MQKPSFDKCKEREFSYVHAQILYCTGQLYGCQGGRHFLPILNSFGSPDAHYPQKTHN